MKKLLLTLLFASPFVAKSQVTVSTSQYTTNELVNSVLLNNGFVPATNITSVTGTNFDSVNGLGYFQKNDSGFQFGNGIILSTGDAVNANGPAIDPILSSGSSAAWVGDADINTVINNSGSTASSNNATALEFDFITLQDQFSMDYIFASNEYGIYQCNYGDVLAILLKDITSDTPYTNIALVPGTNTIVSVATIRDVAYNTACQSANPEYFGYYYPDFAATAPISLRGATIPLRAEAYVTPGHIYHLKLVIADINDSAYDSAIFIEAGSLKCGNLTPDEAAIKSNIGTVLCDGFTAELTVPNNDMFSYEWTYNGNAVNNSTNTLIASQAGEYSVTISLPDTDYSITSAITLTTGGGISDITIDDLTVSEPLSDGIAEFDFSPVMDQLGEIVQGNGNYTTTFHETLNDAETGANPLGYTYTNISNPQTVYARVENGNGCAVIVDFNLSVEQAIIPITLPTIPPYGVCEENTDGQSVFDLNDILSSILTDYYNSSYNISVFHTQYNAENNVGAIEDPSNYTGGNETLSVRVTEVANPSNYSITSLDLIVQNTPNTIPGATYTHCEESLPNDGISVFDLTQMNDQFKGMCSSCSVQYYLTQMEAQNSINPIENPSAFTTSSSAQILFVNVKSPGLLGCSAISTLSVIVNPLPVVSSVPDQYLIDNDETPDDSLTINLNFFHNIIIGENPSQDLTIKYYESESDAIVDMNAIVDTEFYTIATQTLYYRASTAFGCSVIQSFNITVLPSDYETPVPAGETEQTFTPGQTLADLDVDGENILWYLTPGSSTLRGPEEIPLPLSTVLVDGTTYYASQTVNTIESTERLAVTVHFVAGLDEIAFTGLQYYPNPVTDRLSIKNTTNIDTVTVINTLGQTVINNRFNNTEGEINFSNLSSGMYFVRISAENKNKTIKITKN